MRIRLSRLRSIIKEVLDQQAVVPGKFPGNVSGGIGADRHDLDRLGNGGFLLGLDEDDVEEEVSHVHLDEYLNINEGPPGAGMVDPTDHKGFYPYDLPKLDLYGKRDTSKPYRPDDAAEFIGFKTKGATPADAAAESKPPPVSGQKPV